MSAQTVESMSLWIRDNIAESPKLTDMASHFGYSPFYCSAKFREHTGMTFRKFVARCRLEKAVRDIHETDDSVMEIAFRCGYSSPETLTRAFTAAYRCSPRESRRGDIEILEAKNE